MSRSGQAFIAATDGSQFTMYSVMRALGLPLTEEQEKFQSYLERRYPPVVNKEVKPTCFGSFDDEYTMDSDCPRCPEYDNCKETTNDSQRC